MDFHRIEEAALNAWPALEQANYDGWVLRFSEGYTKRANSVNPLSQSSVELEEKIEYCEHAYTKRDLPAIFRLIEPFDLHDLDSKLAEKGYQVFHPTCVMGLELSPSGTKESAKGILRKHRLDTWLEIFSLYVFEIT